MKCSKPARMVTQGGNSPIGGIIKQPPIERDLDMVDAEQASGLAGQWSEKTTCMHFVASREQCGGNNIQKRLWNQTLEPVGALEFWRGRLEGIVPQLVD